MSTAEKIINEIPTLSEAQAEQVYSFTMFIKNQGTSSSGEAKKGVIFGVAEGLFDVPDNIDSMNDEIAEMFGV